MNNSVKLLIGAMAVSVCAGVSSAWVVMRHNVAVSQTGAATVLPAAGAAAFSGALPDFSGVVERCMPSVVNIVSTQSAKEANKRITSQAKSIDTSDPLYQLFMRIYGERLGVNLDATADQAQGAIGSGFIVRADGVILTNAHVVDGADKVVVKLADRRKFEAKLVGMDRRADIAVLKIDATDLPVVKIGDPVLSRVGEWAIAIGSPFEFENTVTTGIISAKSRLNLDKMYTSFIQTDVPVNPGNSGGPLFNMRGEVIGINSWIYSKSGGYQGISFAIPINMAMKIKDAMLANGHVTHIDVGVRVQDVDDNLAKAFGLAKAQGVLVKSVVPGSEGATAGLRVGDVVLAIGGRSVNDVGDVPDLIADIKPGTKVDVQVWRDGVARTLKVTASAMPDESAPDSARPSADVESRLPPTLSADRVGLVVRAMTVDEMSKTGLQQGLMIEETSGLAQDAGIKGGHVIVALNGQPVSTPEAFKRSIERARGNVAILVHDESDQQTYVAIELN
ncbi:Do family serine endopeptidase [Paraburkholderia bannensis]|uniref:Do family serine endopeptidase n=1 Tax=Paraburkholderia bannensis TaxID=765414 RepID=UPI002ABDDE90|nr:Do family serine endopeptidase [Paraburkholderia bannensis]